MAEKLDPKETISILELTVSHMWSIAALVEVLKRKGLLTKQEVRDTITELRRQTPPRTEGVIAILFVDLSNHYACDGIAADSRDFRLTGKCISSGPMARG